MDAEEKAHAEKVAASVLTYVAAAAGRAYLKSSDEGKIARTMAEAWSMERESYLAANQELDRVRRELTAIVARRGDAGFGFDRVLKPVEKLLASLEGDK
jgi:hypothetical protein